ncbi:hypothetical protein A8709_24935 [Paenibacillus pectinilyticus]|uniref:DUF2140 domain-containing protein n=1 Tax=Paenibacillus pectinilyticus TaxID=512399 RepID=A0A1C1A292_9BACL|nr:hypothetical protein [Paenibacillus pectinilyticus]OCT14631.1 hypothetical protein A8709_24935 [Paenibacillus pectinilyticus]
MLKKILLIIVALAVIAVVMLVIVIQYVKPTESLDLHYKEISISSKVADIILSRKLEVRLTEDDVNNLVKKQLADHSVLPNDFRMEGAKLNLQGSTIEADVNLRWQDKVPIGAHTTFTLAWEPPNLVIQHVNTQIRNWQLPSAWLQVAPVEIPLQSFLPKLIGIKNIVFENKDIVIQLKAFQ